MNPDEVRAGDRVAYFPRGTTETGVTGEVVEVRGEGIVTIRLEDGSFVRVGYRKARDASPCWEFLV
jgi:hypothetical protein